MKNVSKWEIAGVPAAVVFGTIYHLGFFDGIGITADELPDLMLLAFVASALLRSTASWWIERSAKAQKE